MDLLHTFLLSFVVMVFLSTFPLRLEKVPPLTIYRSRCGETCMRERKIYMAFFGPFFFLLPSHAFLVLFFRLNLKLDDMCFFI